MLTPGVEALVAGHDLVGVVLEKNIFNYRKYSGKSERNPETEEEIPEITEISGNYRKLRENL
jgi:hypothetical protein